MKKWSASWFSQAVDDIGINRRSSSLAPASSSVKPNSRSSDASMSSSSASRKRTLSLSHSPDGGQRNRAAVSFPIYYDSEPPSFSSIRTRKRCVSGVDRPNPPPQFDSSSPGPLQRFDITCREEIGISESQAKHAPANRALTPSPLKYTTPSYRKRIYFYHKWDEYYGFTNFSSHPVTYNGREYPTSEHLFQSFKFQEHRPFLAEHIRLFSDRPSVALSEARRFQPEVRKDWLSVNMAMMDITLWHKFTQHADLRKELLATGDAILIEDSDKDSFWGVGADRKGRNELGKALERLRSRLRSESGRYEGTKLLAL